MTMICALCNQQTEEKCISPTQHFFTNDKHNKQFGLLGKWIHPSCLERLDAKYDAEQDRIILEIKP